MVRFDLQDHPERDLPDGVTEGEVLALTRTQDLDQVAHYAGFAQPAHLIRRDVQEVTELLSFRLVICRQLPTQHVRLLHLHLL